MNTNSNGSHQQQQQPASPFIIQNGNIYQLTSTTNQTTSNTNININSAIINQNTIIHTNSNGNSTGSNGNCTRVAPKTVIYKTIPTSTTAKQDKPSIVLTTVSKASQQQQQHQQPSIIVVQQPQQQTTVNKQQQKLCYIPVNTLQLGAKTAQQIKTATSHQQLLTAIAANTNSHFVQKREFVIQNNNNNNNNKPNENTTTAINVAPQATITASASQKCLLAQINTLQANQQAFTQLQQNLQTKSQSVIKVEPQQQQSQPQQQQQQQCESAQGLSENKGNILNEYISPDSRIFKSFLKSNDPQQPQQHQQNNVGQLQYLNDVLTYKIVKLGVNEHILLDNNENLLNFSNDIEKLQAFSYILATKLNKPVTIPAYLNVNLNNLDNIQNLLKQRNVKPLFEQNKDLIKKQQEQQQLQMLKVQQPQPQQQQQQTIILQQKPNEILQVQTQQQQQQPRLESFSQLASGILNRKQQQHNEFNISFSKNGQI